MADETPSQPTMAELKAGWVKAELVAAAESAAEIEAAPTRARPRDRDDELLSDPPATRDQLGGFAGWRAGRNLRWMIVGVFVVIAIVVAIVSWQRSARDEYERLHPLPELEATIADGTPREMTVADGQFRLGIARDPPAINVVHLPDRDITLAKGQAKAQFKVEVAQGKTLTLKVLTGKIVETLHEGAEPLLD